VRAAILAMLVACGGESPPPQLEHSELDEAIEANWKLIKANQAEIDQLLKSINTAAERTTVVRKMVDCTVTALDSKMNDRDQVLTIDACFREAGYRP